MKGDGKLDEYVLVSPHQYDGLWKIWDYKGRCPSCGAPEGRICTNTWITKGLLDNPSTDGLAGTNGSHTLIAVHTSRLRAAGLLEPAVDTPASFLTVTL